MPDTRIFARVFDAPRTDSLPSHGETVVVLLLGTEPSGYEVAVDDLADVLDRADTTWMVSVGSPSAGSLATQPELDPGGDDAVAVAVCRDGATDADRATVAWWPIGSTDDPVTPTSDAILTTAARVAIGDLDDVDTTTVPPTDGQALVWDGDDERWTPGTVGGGTDGRAGSADRSVILKMQSATIAGLIGMFGWGAVPASGTYYDSSGFAYVDKDAETLTPYAVEPGASVFVATLLAPGPEDVYRSYRTDGDGLLPTLDPGDLDADAFDVPAASVVVADWTPSGVLADLGDDPNLDAIARKVDEIGITPDATQVAYTGHGLLTGAANAFDGFGEIEGYLDNERYVDDYFLDAVDPDLFADAVADVDQPTGLDGRKIQKGDFVATLGNVGETGDDGLLHWIAIVHPDTGQWGYSPSDDPSDWANAISTNYLIGGSKFVTRAGTIGIYRGKYGTFDRGGPTPFLELPGTYGPGFWMITRSSVLTSPDGTRYQVVVDNAGNLDTEELT